MSCLLLVVSASRTFMVAMIDVEVVRPADGRRPMADRGKEWLAMNGLAIVLARGRIKDLAGRKKDLAESSQLDRILSTAATSADDIVNNIMNHECGIRKPSS